MVVKEKPATFYECHIYEADKKVPILHSNDYVSNDLNYTSNYSESEEINEDEMQKGGGVIRSKHQTGKRRSHIVETSRKWKE